MQHYEFSEEAIVSLYIALEASFPLVLRHLREREGVKNPSAHDAAVRLHEHFDAPFGLPPDETERYFETFYEERVMTLHPASRYGELPYAPIMHNDIPHLRQ